MRERKLEKRKWQRRIKVVEELKKKEAWEKRGRFRIVIDQSGVLLSLIQ